MLFKKLLQNVAITELARKVLESFRIVLLIFNYITFTTK